MAFIWLTMDASVTRQGFAKQKPERAYRHTLPATYKTTRSLSAIARQSPAGQWHHPILAAKLSHRHTAFSLTQDRKDLGFCISRHLHLNLLMHLAEKILLPQPLTFGGITKHRLPAMGQAHDLRETDRLIYGLSAGHLLADRAFDADWLRNDLLERDIVPVIPPKSNRKFPTEFNKETYKWRRLIENYFGKLKENRGIAMRSCKTDQSFKAFISIATIIIHTR